MITFIEFLTESPVDSLEHELMIKFRTKGKMEGEDAYNHAEFTILVALLAAITTKLAGGKLEPNIRFELRWFMRDTEPNITPALNRLRSIYTNLVQGNNVGEVGNAEYWIEYNRIMHHQWTEKFPWLAKYWPLIDKIAQQKAQEY